MTPLVSALLLYLSLLVLLAVISASETAIHSARDLARELTAAGKGTVASQLREITTTPFRQLHRALVLSAALNLALATLGVWIVTGPLRERGWDPWLASSLLFTITVILGDIVPKFFAARSPSVVLLASLRLLRPLRPILDPLTAFTERAADALLQKIIPHHLKSRLPVTRDEFDTLVEMRQEQGALDTDEGSMIQEALAMENLTVRDCMVPRVDLALMDGDDPDDETASFLERATGRFVIVYRKTPDTVIGILDPQHWKLAGRPDWRTILQTPAFVPETMHTLDALDEHLRQGSLPLIIVDEYGGLEGAITRSDIADWLLYDAAPWHGEATEIRELGHGRYLLDGGTRLDHIRDELDIDLNFEFEGIDTIGGLVFNHLGRIPKAGERLRIKDSDIKVRRVVRARIQEVELRIEATQTDDSSS
jgi:putative hemolysin